MRIKSIKLENFRCIQDELLLLDNPTVMVGRNGAGKSTFLHAIGTFYDVSANITQEDFFNRDIKRTIKIKITFCYLRDDEKEEFKSYIKGEELIVTKKIYFNEGMFEQRYYGSIMQVPQLAEIRGLNGKREQKDAWNELVKKKELPDLDDNKKATTAEQVEQYMADYEAGHSNLTKPIEKETEFFGARGVGGGKLNKYTKFVFVPAVKELNEEILDKKGAIEQLIDMIVVRRVESREDVQGFKKKFKDELAKLYSSDNLKELSELGNSISEKLKKFSPGSDLKLKWDDIAPPEIDLPSPIVTLTEDDFEGDVSKKGHGLQRALILTLLQQLAITKHIQEESSEEETAASNKERPPDLILGIEEPELFLHPSRCRYLANLFYKLSDNKEENKNQIIYATHSPYFIDLNQFDKIRVIRKSKCPKTKIGHSCVGQFVLNEAAKESARIYDVAGPSHTAESFRSRAIPVMNVIVNEGFFADLVVVVEGLSDVGILYKLQEIKSLEWVEKGIVIIPACGKNNLDRPVIIFRGLKIPTYFVFDGDSSQQGKQQEEDTKKRNHRYLRMANTDVEDFPNTKVDSMWAVFKDNIEDEIKKSLPAGVYDEITNQAATELGYEQPKQVIKNIEGASRIIELIYEKGHSVPILEGVLSKIEELRRRS